jgi:hypothetical protein
VVALAESDERDANDRQVVGFTAAGGEHDVVRLAPEQGGDLHSRGADGLAGGVAVRVPAGWVAEVLLEVRAHGRERGGRDRRRRVVVEVDQGRFVARMVEPMAPYFAALRRVSANVERA